MAADPLSVLTRLARILDALGIPYVVGGSFASSMYGIPRATQDVDLVADIGNSHVEGLVRALTGVFYVDADMIRDAIAHGTSFNVIHLASMFKADIFLPRGDEWSRVEMSRVRVEKLGPPAEGTPVRFASPEDTLLHKLLWYRMGNEVSDRQWNDILGVLRVQADALDHRYLDHWAPLLGVSDLLARARRQT